MAANNVRKNMNIFVEGQGYAGQIEEFNAPKLTQKTEDFRAGGMNGTVKLAMGLEALDADFSMVSYDAPLLGRFGVVEGFDGTFLLREMLESFDGTVTAVQHAMRGKVIEIDAGSSKPGDKPTTKYQLSLNYYKLTHGGRVVQEIDLINMVHIVNGVDQLAAQRAALGI